MIYKGELRMTGVVIEYDLDVRRSWFDSQQGKDIILFYSVQAG
jgi:hypothetical protein